MFIATAIIDLIKVNVVAASTSYETNCLRS
jgi:hypothetical protein